ncbi:MAG TPA: hypothetical protein QGG47_13150 [Acidobacteriota bacterium]|nr:hypothetical protein [Acidobacteriota bacterium]
MAQLRIRARLARAATIITAAVFSTLLALPAAHAQRRGEILQVEGERLRPTRSVSTILQNTHLRRSDPTAPVAFRIELPELRQPAPPPSADKTRLQVGVHRDLADPRARGIDGALLEWEPARGGGYTTTFAVTSAGATGIQLALRVAALPADAEVRFFNPSDPADAHGPFLSELLVRSIEATGRQDDSDLFWSPVIGGDELGGRDLPAATSQGRRGTPHRG